MEQSKVDNIIELAATLAGRSDEIEDCIVIYSLKSGGTFSIDTGITVSEALFLVESFKHWMLTCMNKKEET